MSFVVYKIETIHVELNMFIDTQMRYLWVATGVILYVYITFLTCRSVVCDQIYTEW